MKVLCFLSKLLELLTKLTYKEMIKKKGFIGNYIKEKKV
jgi:hypothetical protein